MEYSKNCRLCPRNCGADRKNVPGRCKGTSAARVARVAPHEWEEPCISGKNGSGTVFFSGCSLGCVFCQNHAISHGGMGKEISDSTLAEIFISLKERGVHNINLVNPTHYLPNILNALDMAKSHLDIPVVWNTGGYEKAENVRLLEGYVDIFLPDLKYVSPDISEKYSGASDYFQFASRAIEEMFRIAGYPVFDENGMMTRGVMIRHLVLPSHVSESKRVIDHIAANYDIQRVWLSLMCQYFPTHRADQFPEISRRLTTLEYQRVAQHAAKSGIVHGYLQDKASAGGQYVPEFSDNPEF